MLRYRSFHNTDPPVLAAIWRSRAGQQGLLQPISIDVFEQFVLGKVYFDYEGLILAFDDDRPVGFAHAAFGPDETRDRISTEKGVTCILVVCPDCDEAEVAAGLLERCEAYLCCRGASVLYGGAVQPLDPFYLGLYGGSRLPGVLLSDVVAQQLYRTHGYEEIDRMLLLRGDLASFRPPIDRRQVQLRRKMIVEERADPPARNWWEACTVGDFDLTRFELVRRGGGPVLARATVREMEPTIDSGAGRIVGLMDVEVVPAHRRQGLATFLLAESFRHLARQGAAAVEAQATHRNTAGLGLLEKLGLKQVAEGIVFRKDVDGP